MKKLLLIYLAITITSCFHLSQRESKSNEQQWDANLSSPKEGVIHSIKDTTLDREIIQLSNPSASLIDIVLLLLEDELKPSDIDRISKFQNENILTYGEVELMKVSLASSVPTVAYGEYVLLLGKKRSEAVLFPLADFQLIRVDEDSYGGLMAGTYTGRNFGHFTVYSYAGNNKFECIFTSLSDKFCQDGLPTYNTSLECMSYHPFNLKFENKDINGDHLLDLVFSGEVFYFCEGLEVGIGRLDREPIRKEQVSFAFLGRADVATKTFAWELANDNICDVLK